MKKSLCSLLMMLLCVLSCQNSNNDSYSGYWVVKSTPEYLIKIDDNNHTIWAGFVTKMPKTREEADKFIYEHEDPLLCSYEEREGAVFAEYWDKPYFSIKDGVVVVNSEGWWDNEPVKKLWDLKETASSVGSGESRDWLNGYWYVEGELLGCLIKINGDKISISEPDKKPSSMGEAEETFRGEYSSTVDSRFKIKDDKIYVIDEDGSRGKKGDYVSMCIIKGESLIMEWSGVKFEKLWNLHGKSQNENRNNAERNDNAARTAQSIHFTSPMDVISYLRGNSFKSTDGNSLTMTFTSTPEMVVNGTEITGAMHIEDFNSTQAILIGVSPYDGGTVRIRVDAARGTITNIDKPSEVYKLSQKKKGGINMRF